MTGSNDSPGSDGLFPDFEAWQRRYFEYKLTGLNKPPHPTIDMLWQSFSKCLGTELHPSIRDLVEQAFYSGTYAFTFIVHRVGEVWDGEEGSRILDKLEQELRDYAVARAAAKGVTLNQDSSIIQ